MIINESLVARTFGTYILQIFDAKDLHFMIPILGVILVLAAFIINWSGTDLVEKSSTIMAVLKIGGITIFAIGALAVTGFSFGERIASSEISSYPITSYLGALALTILAYKGFTTITNSGSEIVKPHKNVGRAIVISLIICAVIYLLVSFAVSSNLSIDDIIKAKDYSLAAASEPAFGKYGVWFTVFIAIIATASGIVASIFAVSRMTAMLTEMKLIPHSHLGMKGPVQKHMLVYIATVAIILTVFFDLSRIAAMGAIFYIIMDIIIQWGVLTRLRKTVKANAGIIISAIIFDVVILAGFLIVKVESDPVVLIVSGAGIILIFLGEKLFLRERQTGKSG
jgi:amino acid transporter